MEDASAALGGGSIIGSMLAARTALIRAQRHQKKELGLEHASLKSLLEAGRISQFQFESSDLARRWAGYLGHEETDPEKLFTKADAEQFYEYVESLLNSIYVEWERFQISKEKLIGNDSIDE